MIDGLSAWHAAKKSLGYQFMNVVRAGDSTNTEFDALIALAINGGFQKYFLPAKWANLAADLPDIRDLVEGFITKYRIPHGHSKSF